MEQLLLREKVLLSNRLRVIKDILSPSKKHTFEGAAGLLLLLLLLLKSSIKSSMENSVDEGLISQNTKLSGLKMNVVSSQKKPIQGRYIKSIRICSRLLALLIARVCALFRSMADRK